MDLPKELLQFSGNILLCVSAVVATASVILHARVQWWVSQMGRHLMAYMAVMAAVLDMGTIKLIVGDSPGFALLRLVVFALVPAVMAWRVWLQIQAQRAVHAPARSDDADA